ncbi:transcription/translation regulatory transformer protein RfaH [Photobacterium kishitanii]|uniref:Transcription antitermination protein RfaH n=1 Tax=Photobacterium kishitanii TaxID=318456 RepID=A0A2T3KFZ0_9GAMM|nr:transcription/translation regulatory transformer protein RfaH [Photobacterium kishitanii]PSU97695.1 transcription/translation regulatory transformer protein RfaH [Photobacterium kishitanii]
MKDWYLLYCKRSEQERAVINLDRQGAECYYPQVVVEKIVRGKRCECYEPLFPSYVFVTFDPEQLSFTTVRSTRGVADFIRQGAMPQIVSEELIYNLMTNEANNSYDHMFESLPQQGDKLILEQGDKLILEQGEFKGLDAIYQEPDGEKRSFMLINLLGKQVKVSVENTDLVKNKA